MNSDGVEVRGSDDGTDDAHDHIGDLVDDRLEGVADNDTVEELKTFEPELRQLFHKMIDHGLAFELNCKSMYLYGHEELYIYALFLVKELGGQRFSVGSDGHKLEHFRLQFDQNIIGCNIIRSLGNQMLE